MELYSHISCLFFVIILLTNDALGLILAPSKSADKAVFGTNVYQLTCTYTLDNGDTLYYIQLKRQRDGEADSKAIIFFNQNQNASYQEIGDGGDLESRTIASSLGSGSGSIQVQFSSIKCVDKATYTWIASYANTSGPQTMSSNIIVPVTAISTFEERISPVFSPSTSLKEGDNVTFTCAGVAVVSVAYIRVHQFKPATVPGQDFFGAVAMSFVVAAFLLISTWVGWQGVTENTWNSATRDRLAINNGAVYNYIYGNESWEFQNYCSINGTSVPLPANLADDETAAIESACQKSETVWFLQWAAPCVLGICNSIVAGVCWVFAKATAALELEREGDVHHFQKVLKLCASLIVLMLGVMYSAQYVSGADVTVSSALLALGAGSMTAILLFMLLEFGFERLHQSTQQDGLAKSLISIAKSDWMKALVIGGLNVFIPTLAVLDRLRQKIRRCTGLAPSDDTSPFTKEGRQIIGEMSKWTWCSIFLKIATLGEIFVSLIVGMKVTYVFFSWLNETLAAAELPFAVLAVLVLGVALVMFLCPIVPGSAVYLFSGVIFGAQSQLPGSIGFPLGVIAASALSSLAKMIACCLQYGLGFLMGKSVKVQQFVGVDKVSIRAMEQILKQNGLKPDKVGILVAGPDWPTSVLCGILRLNIPQMLLGTTPVILVSIAPQVLVGAFQTLADGKSGIMGMVSSSVTMAAAVVQALAMFFVSYRIMKVIEEDGPTLALPRPEHEAVAELTRKEAVYTEALRNASEWANMKCGQKFLAFTSAVCLLLAGFLLSTDFILSEKFCFRSFSITSSIGAAIEVGGLNGNVANLVMLAGWLALGIAFAGFLLHVVLSKWLAHAARSHLRSNSPDQPKGSTIGRPLKRDTE